MYHFVNRHNTKTEFIKNLEMCNTSLKMIVIIFLCIYTKIIFIAPTLTILIHLALVKIIVI